MELLDAGSWLPLSGVDISMLPLVVSPLLEALKRAHHVQVLILLPCVPQAGITFLAGYGKA